MLKIRLIPCLDVKDGRVVKGVNFVDLRDAGDPVEAAAAYDEAGADELCFLDITASHEKRGTILDVVRRTAERCFMPLTVGGGVRSIDDVRALLEAGADKVSINTAAVKDRSLVRAASEKFGAQCIVVAIDAKRVAGDGGTPRFEIFTHGGREATGIDAVAYAREVAALGAGEILLTSMDRDGTRKGFDLELTRAIADAVTVPVIASGGRGHARSPGRGRPPGPRLGRARGLDLPLWRTLDRRGQAPYGRRGPADAARPLTAAAARPAPVMPPFGEYLRSFLFQWPRRRCMSQVMSKDVLSRLAAIIKSRRHARPEDSHTRRLLDDGPIKPAKKLGEEAVEVAIAALSQGKKAPDRRERRSALPSAGGAGVPRGRP